MADNNEQVRITMTSGDNEVVEEMQRLRAELEKTKQDMKDLGRTSRQTTRDAKEDVQTLGGGLTSVTGTLRQMAGILAGLQGYDAIKNIAFQVGQLVDELGKALEVQRNLESATFASTGFGGVSKTARGVLNSFESGMLPGQRQKLLEQIAGAAPALQQGTQLQTARLVAEKGFDAFGRDANKAFQLSQISADLQEAAGFSPSQAADLATVFMSAPGNAAGQFGQIDQIARIIAAGGGTDQQGAYIESLALGTAAVNSALPAEFLNTGFSKISALRANGVKDPVTGQMRVPQILQEGSLTDAFLRVVQSNDPKLMQQIFGSEQALKAGAFRVDEYNRLLDSFSNSGGALARKLAEDQSDEDSRVLRRTGILRAEASIKEIGSQQAKDQLLTNRRIEEYRSSIAAKMPVVSRMAANPVLRQDPMFQAWNAAAAGLRGSQEGPPAPSNSAQQPTIVIQNNQWSPASRDIPAQSY